MVSTILSTKKFLMASVKKFFDKSKKLYGKKYITYFSFDIQLSGNEENEDCNRLGQTENTKMRLPL